MNYGIQKDDKVQATSTTVVGSTGDLVTQATEDFDEINFRVPIAAITGSPQFIVSSSPDNNTYTDEVTFTRSSSDNGKVLIITVLKPNKAYYKLKLNLNSGTVKLAVEAVTVERFRPRKIPFTSTTATVLTHIAL